MVFIQCSSCVIAQPVLNESYFFGRQAHVIGSVISTDSCYFSIGTISNDLLPSHQDLVFTKFDHSGNVISQTFTHNDSLQYSFFGTDNLTETFSNEFVALGIASPYPAFVKFTESGDTIFLKVIEDFYLNDSLITVRACNIVQLPEDSSYTSLIWVYHENNLDSKCILLNISKDGDLDYYNIYEKPNLNYTELYPGSFLRLQDKSYLIASELFKYGTPVENSRHHPYFLKVDSAGNYLDDFIEDTNDHVYRPKSLFPTSDGGYLYCGEKAVYAQNITYKKRNFVCKLSNDFTIDWEFEYDDTVAGVGLDIGYEKILPLANNEFIAIGTARHDTINRGTILKFNLNGDLIWDSYFNFVPFETIGNIPIHYFYDIEETTDGGFVLIGEIQDKVEQSNGNPFQSGWLVKVDSNGCIVSGCQDFIGFSPKFKSIYNIYPNPTRQYINIAGVLETCTTFILFDLLGNQVITEKIDQESDIIKIDLTGIESGTYILNIENSNSVFTEKVIIK